MTRTYVHPPAYSHRMASIDDVRRFLADEQGLAVVSVTRRDRSISSSVVNCGVLPHPVDGADVVAFVVRGDAAKLRRLRHDPRLTIAVRSGWRWVAAEGAVELCGPDDALDGVDVSEVPQLLRDVFVAAGGSHDDWDEYDRVMASAGKT